MDIRIIDAIGDRATDMRQGDSICKMIVSGFEAGEHVTLDFEGMKTILSTFLNTAIGKLYQNYTSEFLNANLRLVNICPEDKFILSRVIARAKDFYSNPALITEALDEAL